MDDDASGTTKAAPTARRRGAGGRCGRSSCIRVGLWGRSLTPHGCDFARSYRIADTSLATGSFSARSGCSILRLPPPPRVSDSVFCRGDIDGGTITLSRLLQGLFGLDSSQPCPALEITDDVVAGHVTPATKQTFGWWTEQPIVEPLPDGGGRTIISAREICNVVKRLHRRWLHRRRTRLDRGHFDQFRQGGMRYDDGVTRLRVLKQPSAELQNVGCHNGEFLSRSARPVLPGS